MTAKPWAPFSKSLTFPKKRYISATNFIEMENSQTDAAEYIILDEQQSNLRKFMSGVFTWMFVALGLSAAFAYFFATDASLLSLLVDTESGEMSWFGKIALFSPLIMVLIMSFSFNRLSYLALMLIFVTYAALTGISLSFVLLAYTAGSVYTCFISAAALFGVMAVAGYYTQQDLTKFGAILTFLLVGIIIASLVNWFLGSEQLDYIISFVGVAVFVGLTAYDVQKLKRIGMGVEYGEASTQKMMIMGALRLYLDFINLFLMLLRLFGRRN